MKHTHYGQSANKDASPYQYSTAINRERGDRRIGSDRRRCTLPDIIFYNFMSPRMDGRRRAGRKCSNGPAIYESKTISACGTRCNLRNQKAVESRANAIRSEYARKVKVIDRVFAPDMVVNQVMFLARFRMPTTPFIRVASYHSLSALTARSMRSSMTYSRFVFGWL